MLSSLMFTPKSKFWWRCDKCCDARSAEAKKGCKAGRILEPNDEQQLCQLVNYPIKMKIETIICLISSL